MFYHYLKWYTCIPIVLEKMKLGGIRFELKAIELLKLCYMKELRMFHTKLFCILYFSTVNLMQFSNSKYKIWVQCISYYLQVFYKVFHNYELTSVDKYWVIPFWLLFQINYFIFCILNSISLPPDSR